MGGLGRVGGDEFEVGKKQCTGFLRGEEGAGKG